MADLAKVQTNPGVRRRGSVNRDAFLPTRRNTDAPELEVNAVVSRPSNAEAEELKEILGMATRAAEAGVGLWGADRDQKDKISAADGALDAASGRKDEERIANSRAYAKAFYVEGAKRAGLELDQRLTTRIEDRLADENDPATPEDIQELIDGEFASISLDERGLPRDFGDPAAGMTLARQFQETRARLMGAAVPVIREREQAKLIDTVAFNVIEEGVPLAVGAAPAGTVDVPASVPETPVTGEAPVVAALSGLPVRGAVTSSFGRRKAPIAGASTNHNGIDIAAAAGEPVEIRAGGTVRTGFDKKSGNYVIVDHGGGITSSYSHLSKVNVADGDVIGPGTSVGLVGATGNVSGAHLHYVVRKDGRAVDPTTFTFPDGGGTAAPAVQPVKPAVEAAAPVVDFEAVMARVPSTIPRGKAKAGLLAAFIQRADEGGDYAMLDGLWRAKRADGTPSFSPQEITTIRDARDAVKNRARVEAERTKNQRWEDNADRLLTEFVEGRDPSISTIREWTRRGDIDPNFGFSLVNSIESEQKADAREARADAREAEREADNDLDVALAAEMESRRLGVIAGASLADDNRRFAAGEFGSGRRGAARYRMMRNAARQGAAEALKSPEAAAFAARIDAEFKPVAGKSRVLSARGSVQRTPAAHAAALAGFKREIANGTPPAEAYQKVRKQYGEAGTADAFRAVGARRDRLAELRARSQQ